MKLLLCRGSYDISQKKPVAGSNFTQVVKGNSTVKVDSTDYYVLVIANNAGTSPADVLYQFATYSVNSSGEICAAVQADLVLTGRAAARALRLYPPSWHVSDCKVWASKLQWHECSHAL